MKVLIGVDGSRASEGAVELTGRLLSTLDSEVTLYYSPPLSRLRGVDDSNPALLEAMRQSLTEVVFARAKDHLPESLRARATTIAGTRKASKGILLAAAHSGPDMIAIGATGASRIAKMLLGSVSRAVVHGAGVPVLVARVSERVRGPLRVLLAFDREGISDDAIQFAKRLAWPPDSLGYAVHVKESIFHGPLSDWVVGEMPQIRPEPLVQAWVDEEEREAKAAEQELKAVCEALPPPFRGIQPVLLEGHPGERILEFIETNKIDLVIIGARVQSPVERVLTGSTSEYVLAHAGCSALIVPHYEAP